MESTFFEHRINRVLAGAVLVMLVVALGAHANATMMQASHGPNGPSTISISGEGEILAKPDIGNFSFSVMSEGTDGAEAQKASGEVVNTILVYLDEAGVAEADIKTQNYSLNPKYRYEERTCVSGSFCPPGERVIDGYQVNQNVSVKVRDLDEAGTLIAGVGERGATNISSLQFTIDDEEVLQAEARAEAIADAKKKARVLAKDLGVHLGKVVSFSENGGYNPQPYFAETRAMSFDMAEEAAFAPELPVGENTIRSEVTVTFELR